MAATVLQIPSQIFSDNALSSAKLPNRLSNSNSSLTRFRVRAVQEKNEEIKTPSSLEEITKKYGLEAGLWKIFSAKEDGNEENKESYSKGNQAKELLAKYGGAYLATSITLSLISFGLCYALISAGVDVSALLQKVGISTNETGEKLGTSALAYAAHFFASSFGTVTVSTPFSLAALISSIFAPSGILKRRRNLPLLLSRRCHLSFFSSFSPLLSPLIRSTLPSSTSTFTSSFFSPGRSALNT